MILWGTVLVMAGTLVPLFRGYYYCGIVSRRE